MILAALISPCRVLAKTFRRDGPGTCVPEQLHILDLKKALLAWKPGHSHAPSDSSYNLSPFPLTGQYPLVRADAVSELLKSLVLAETGRL